MPEDESNRTSASQPIEEGADWGTCPKHNLRFPLGSSCPQCSLDWDICPRHGISFPRGSSCPQCGIEDQGH